MISEAAAATSQAARHDVPFYVAAPISSIDLDTPTGADIPIEERSGEEVLQVRGVRIAPPDTDVRNPAFDVTPAALVTALVTEAGVVERPDETGLAPLLTPSPRLQTRARRGR